MQSIIPLWRLLKLRDLKRYSASHSHFRIWIGMTIIPPLIVETLVSLQVRQIGDRGSCWLRWKLIGSAAKAAGAVREPKRGNSRHYLWMALTVCQMGLSIISSGLQTDVTRGGPSTFGSPQSCTMVCLTTRHVFVKGRKENNVRLRFFFFSVCLHFRTVWQRVSDREWQREEECSCSWPPGKLSRYSTMQFVKWF